MPSMDQASPELIVLLSRIDGNFHQEVQNSAQGFPGGAVVKNPPANAGDTGLSPGLGRSHMSWSN